MNPVVTILMGVHKRGDTELLRRSIDSIVGQTYQNWEMIIVDDGSDDGAFNEFLSEMAALDERVIVIGYRENRGLAYALNYGLKIARGRYVARQDDDDYSCPDRLSRQVEYLDSHSDISIVGTNAVLFDEVGEWGNMAMPASPSAKDFLWNSPFIHPSIMMRRDDLAHVGGYRVARETARCEDYDLFMRMYAEGFKGVNLQESLYRYRSERTVSKYRPMARRVEEAVVRARGFCRLGLGPRSLVYIIKPLVIGLIPKGLYGRIQNRRSASRDET